MNKYMLLLHEPTDGSTDTSAQEIQAIIGEYIDWRNKVESEGRLVGGEKLADEGGKHLSMNGEQIRVTDGPYAEIKEVLGGFFSIKARDYDDAVEMSKTCPHLKYGGWIEVRQIESVH